MLLQIFAIFFASMVIHINVAKTNDDDYCVDLFIHADLKGDNLTICDKVENLDVDKYKKFNDVLSSIRLMCRKPCSAQLYEHDYSGYKGVYNSSFVYWTNLECELNDKVSSVRILPDQENQQLPITTNTAVVGDDYLVELYEETFLKGKSLTTSSRKSLNEVNFDDMVSSFRLKCNKYCGVTFYDDVNYEGEGHTYYSFTTDWTNVPCFFANRISSIYVFKPN